MAHFLPLGSTYIIGVKVDVQHSTNGCTLAHRTAQVPAQAIFTLNGAWNVETPIGVNCAVRYGY